MKELSIEEKAKAYDEAKARMSRAFNDNRCSIGFMNEIFPELKESEDERIGKEIIDYFEHYPNIIVKRERRNDWIAWLEKQGEQKVSVVEFNANDWYVSKVDGKIYNAKFMKKNSTNLARKLEIEKAAMSTTGIIDREEWFIKGAKWADENPAYISSEKQGEQKPAWSKEDECIYQSIIDDTVQENQLDGKQIDWLKSLKDRVGCEVNCTTTWKPSESDIRILERVIDGTANPINYQATLHAILEKLKKIKEE